MSKQPTPGQPGSSLPLHQHKPPPADVPVFSCIVYVSRSAEGDVAARVGNLEGLQFRAGSEREVLAKVVAAFKQQVRQATEQNQEIPWIEPPAQPTAAEQTRLIPVHL